MIKFSSFLAAGIILILSPGTGQAQSGAQLAPEEKAFVGFVDRHFDKQVRFLERIVNINSETMNHEGVREVTSLLGGEVSDLGFETRWIDLTGTLNRAGRLAATRKGSAGARLLLIGHMDTAHPPEGPFQTFERAGNRATGPGIDDMKNRLVVMLYALKALEHIGALEDSSICVFFTGEEEMPGRSIKLTRAPLVKAARKADIALNFEPGVAVTSRRGYTGWHLETGGRRSHFSQVFSEAVGAGAVYEMARILHSFYSSLRDEALLTFNVGALVGGTTVSFDSDETYG